MTGEQGPRVVVRGGQGLQIGNHTTQFNQYISAPGLDVPLVVAAKDSGLIFAAVDVDRFVGREWLTAEVDRFLVGNPCGYVFVEAEAGLGKTAFAAWLVKSRGYLSHFSRYPGGRSVRAALQNLSAQLIREFGLDDQASGGMLPEWAQTPAGFDWLLGMAASRSRERGGRVVLVVDGLDEGGPPEQGLPFGLPVLLPNDVFVLATYRTGYRPARPGSPAMTLQIKKDDQRNVRDIREFLTEAAGEEVLAAELAETGMGAAEFVSLLTERCGGIWVYLRYVLAELRIGLRQPGAISDLPAGLRDYYAEQIRGWERDPAWSRALLPLLSILGVAREALPVEALGRLAGGLDPAAVRRWCDFTFRPLLTTTRASGNAARRYEIYHASFREVLTGIDDGRTGGPDDSQPDDLEALADELRQAAIAAHARIADTYLGCFGGLADGLPALAASPGAASLDDGYPLRHLTRHLCHAGRAMDMHALLAAERAPSGNPAGNTWYAAHDHADSIISYLEDVGLARNDSAAVTDQALARRQPAVALGGEIRYALVAASIASLTASIPDSLLGQLIRSGLWSPRRGLDYVRRMASPGRRFAALLTVHGLVSAEDQAVVLAQALDAATAITDEYPRADALARLAPYLPPDLLAQALDAATALTDRSACAMTLTSLAPHLPAAERPATLVRALAAVRSIAEGFSRAAALAALAPYLPRDLLAQALDAAAAIRGDYQRAVALARLAPYLPPDLLAQALDAATALTDRSARARALAALVPYLPAAEQPATLALAIATAYSISSDSSSGGWTLVTPDLPDLPATLVQAITAAATARGFHRATALAALAPYLPPDLLAQAHAAATADDQHASLLDTLAPRLPRDLLAQALAAAIADTRRASLLATLAPHLPPDLLAQAQAAVSSSTDAFDPVTGRALERDEALAALAPHLPPHLLAQALVAATAFPLTTWTERSRRVAALAALAPHLPPDLLDQALAAATAISDDFYRAKALTALAPFLPAAEQPAALAQALAAATAINDNPQCVDALAALVPYLPAAEQPAARAQTAAIAAATADIDSRTDTLATLAACLPHDLLAQALETAITDHSLRPRALARLAPHLPPDLLAQALAAATAATGDIGHEALTYLVPYLPAAEQPAVLARALAGISGDFYRARALARLAPDLASHLSPDLLAPALAAATAITDNSSRAEALTALAPYLSPDLLTQALAAATAIANDGSRAEALARLAPYLPPDLLAQALAAATAITDDSGRAKALAGLAPHLRAAEQPAVLAQALAAARSITGDYTRVRVLGSLAPGLPPELFPQALAAVFAMPGGSGRAEALAALAPRLPPDLLAQALAAATAITDNSGRAEALISLVPHLPADQQGGALSQALAAASRTGSETRVKVLKTARSAHFRDGSGSYVHLLRDSLSGIDRTVCLRVIEAAAPAISEIGGGAAIQQCVDAIVAAHRWWP